MTTTELRNVVFSLSANMCFMRDALLEVIQTEGFEGKWWYDELIEPQEEIDSVLDVLSDDYQLDFSDMNDFNIEEMRLDTIKELFNNYLALLSNLKTNVFDLIEDSSISDFRKELAENIEIIAALNNTLYE